MKKDFFAQVFLLFIFVPIQSKRLKCFHSKRYFQLKGKPSLKPYSPIMKLNFFQWTILKSGFTDHTKKNLFLTYMLIILTHYRVSSSYYKQCRRASHRLIFFFSLLSFMHTHTHQQKLHWFRKYLNENRLYLKKKEIPCVLSSKAINVERKWNFVIKMNGNPFELTDDFNAST